MDELCISKKRNLWLWTAVSRYSGHILAWHIGDRKWNNVGRLYALLPNRYKQRSVYTDGYRAYAAFFAPWQHRLCQKFDGGTCVVEGVNNSLRHRCGALVRRSSAKCRSGEMWNKRVAIAIEAHNKNTDKRLKRAKRCHKIRS